MSETRTRTYSWQDPLALRDEMVARSGLELMQLMAAGELSPPPIAETLGFRLVEAERGHAVFECQPAEYHYNPIGMVHAGLAMTLMDSAMGLAFVTTLDEPVGWTTLEVKTNFTRALTVDSGVVRCIGSIVHPGRRVATTEARVEDSAGRLCAHGTSTILVLGGLRRATLSHASRRQRLLAVPGSPAAPQRLAAERRDRSSLDSRAMEPLYDPRGVEARWQETWEGEGLYAAEPDSERPSFVIAVPPPNVTGELHMGHALNASIQDLLVRYHRMRGFSTLWQPGYDHAGIATQNVVERDLAKEGLTRHDLGREAFVERTWRWLEHYGGVIYGQFRRLGASLDYPRERFTMDEGYVRAVLKYFVHLYDRGLLYRDNRIVNWCPRCASAISDLEVNHPEVDDRLFTIRYPLADGTGHLTIATVRPPTMLADVGVAVHPDDERYAHLVGKEAIVPVVERRVPIVADDRVDPEFGTGAVKITPGHDPTDFEIGRTHGLPELTVIGLDGRMNDDAGEFAGLTQAEAQERIVAILRERDLLEADEPYRHAVGHCDRCGTRIEPLITLQWWCDMTELAAPAIEVVRDGRVRFRPERYTDVYLRWMESIRPWCVSRQLWWGHRIPVWYCPDGHLTVVESEPQACAECGATDLRQDEDVLDTWFSSQLWPFATLGWPDDTPGAPRLVPERRQLDRPRDHLPLGGADDHGRDRAHGRAPVPHREHPLDDQRARRQADVEEPRDGDRPAGGGRRVRGGRDALRAPQELVHAGRALLVRHDRGGAQARDQALERLAPDPPELGGCDAECGAA